MSGIKKPWNPHDEMLRLVDTSPKLEGEEIVEPVRTEEEAKLWKKRCDVIERIIRRKETTLEEALKYLEEHPELLH